MARKPSIMSLWPAALLSSLAILNMIPLVSATSSPAYVQGTNSAGHTIQLLDNGEDRFDLTFNPCNANFGKSMSMNSSKPINGEAIIPVSASDVSGIPNIALVIPDFEGSATLRVFFEYVPHIRTHYAHSLSVLVVFEVFQSIFFSGALSVDWPSVLPAFWSNFAWSAGLIYVPSIVKSVNGFTGISGNSSQVGGAGSSTINNNGGLQQQIYGRSLAKLQEYSHWSKMARGNEMVKRMASLTKRAASNNSTKGYDWNGDPVGAGLPLPGSWSNFTGTLANVDVPASDAFLVGFLWYLILVVILVAAAIMFKFILEAFSKMKWMKEDRLALFRTKWVIFIGLIVLRSMLIAFFMIMTLSLYQFSYGGTTGIIAIAAIIFLIFLFGILALSFYACYFRLRFGNYALSPDRIHFQRKRVMKFLPWYGVVRKSNMEEGDKANTSGSILFFRVHYVDQDKERQSLDTEELVGGSSHFGVVYQFVRACFVGGARDSPAAQVFGNLVVEVIAFITIIWLNPFEGARNTALAVYMLGISKVATAGLSVAFLPRYNVARIPTTVIGVIIIVIQGFLTIGLLILIVLGAISSYMSVMRNREDFKPRNLQNIRTKYFDHLELKAVDLPPPPPPVPEEPKEPYFSVTQVRRAPKIEDEDVVPEMTEMPEMRGNRDPNASQHSLPAGGRSRAASMRSQHSGYGNVPYGARVHRASWSSRDFQNWQQDEIARGNSPFNTPSRQPSMHHTANNSTSTAPLVRPKMSQTSLRSNTPKKEKTAQYADQRFSRLEKHGVATVWLVATLGSKSSTKKVTRKAILDVNVKKACHTILEPDAPMALRLQSNLLYGVSRVYSQQVGYVLSDTIHVEQGLRGLGKKVAGNLDMEGSKIKPAQLMLMDDPAFDLNMSPPGLIPDYDLNIDAGQSQNRDSQTSLSIHSQHGRNTSISSQAASIMGLNISSSLSAGGYQLPLNDPLAKSSAQKSGINRAGFDDEAILDLTAQDISSRRVASTNVAPRFGSDSAASARVRKEHEDARAQAEAHGRKYDEDDDVKMVFGDDAGPHMLPDAEPFDIPPFMNGALHAPIEGQEPSLSQPEESSSESAVAPLRPRKPKTKKQLPIDQTQELKHSDLSDWQKEYVNIQNGLSAVKLKTKGYILAKKNAQMFVIGSGFNGVGIGVGSTKLQAPLNMFSGDALLAKISGRVSTKRKADLNGGDVGTRKRIHHSSDEEIPREFKEMGRDAADALTDCPSSAMMPWNISVSQKSSLFKFSPRCSLRIGGREFPLVLWWAEEIFLLSAGDLENFSSQQDVIMYGRSDNMSTDLYGESCGVPDMNRELAGDDQASREFEMFGPAANVDTQTAEQSQWIRDIMDTESDNFLDFVRLLISERYNEEEDIFREGGQLKRQESEI
ncbi:hypothetical protein DID88_006733 [Monilinia fructigena]|uniref:Rad21/Rec8-like protein N-terminal domain-containing protein n=1 Tax=Monilinia fructigena TaxID=38457 RepID=A0A395IFM6_9HELO|nr:hypothetical protein DID88_006733 [Monilinia fructigena]